MWQAIVIGFLSLAVIVLTSILIYGVTRPIVFGVKYKPANADVKEFMNLWQAKLDTTNAELAGQITNFIAMAESMPANPTPEACVIPPMTGIPSQHHAFATDLFKFASRRLCTGGVVDKIKVLNFMKAIRDSLLYK
jgi:hypothetical protein